MKRSDFFLVGLLALVITSLVLSCSDKSDSADPIDNPKDTTENPIDTTSKPPVDTTKKPPIDTVKPKDTYKLDSALLIYLPFEDNTDNKGLASLTSSLKGLVSYQAGVQGKSMKLSDAERSYILFENPDASLANLGSFSISCWIQRERGEKGFEGLFAIANKETFWGNLEFFLDGGVVKVLAQTNADESTAKELWTNVDGVPFYGTDWKHVVVSYNNEDSSLKIYLNGSLAEQTNTASATFKGGLLEFVNMGAFVVGTASFETDPSLTSAHGAENWGYPNYQGLMDEFRFYAKRVLTAEEITYMYQNKK